jgi:hypothetical protein
MMPGWPVCYERGPISWGLTTYESVCARGARPARAISWGLTAYLTGPYAFGVPGEFIQHFFVGGSRCDWSLSGAEIPSLHVV